MAEVPSHVIMSFQTEISQAMYKQIITILFITAMLVNTSSIAVAQDAPAMTIITEGGLTYMYPHYNRVGIVCGEMPSQNDSSVLFVAAAAFTGQLLEDFAHTNIAGNHVANGIFYEGYLCDDINTGAFTYHDGKWAFHLQPYAEAVHAAANGTDGAAFCQCLLLYNGALVDEIPLRSKFTTERRGQIYYRALCEKNGKLCIVESEKETTFAAYLDCLAASGITHAIYMDGNSGWNYSWYRNNQGEVVEIHSKTARSRFCTNWVYFLNP